MFWKKGKPCDGKLAVLVFALLLFFAVPAFAFLGPVGDYLAEKGTEALVGLGIAAVFGILGIFVKKAVVWKTTATEGVQVVLQIMKSVKASSPGGKRITAEEMKAIMEETRHFGTAFEEAWIQYVTSPVEETKPPEAAAPTPKAVSAPKAVQTAERKGSGTVDFG